MKTEEFDDAIKRKLESINPTFSEKDIERVHKYTLANRSPFSILGSNRAFWTLMATGMLVTALVTWKITSMFIHQPNPQIIVKNQTGAPIEQKTSPTKIITKTDTVYVTKYKYINKYPNSYPATQSFLIKKENATGKQYAQLPVSENNITKGQLQNNVPVPEKVQNTATSVESNIDSKTSGPVEGKQSNESITKNIAETQVSNASPDLKNITPVKKSDSVAVPGKKEIVKKEIAKKRPIHDYADEHKNASHEKPVNNLPFMIGAGAETTLANPESGYGVFAKMLLSDQFSVNVGLKFMNVNHQYYNTDLDFDLANRYSFQWLYAKNIWGPIKNINFNYSLTQLPIAFEYDLPLGHNWSVSAALGTDIDLSCKNTLTYDYIKENSYPTDFVSKSQTENYPTLAFNNMVGSVGLIYQIHHFDIQLSPFVSKQDIYTWYKGKTEWYEGASLKAFYSF